MFDGVYGYFFTAEKSDSKHTPSLYEKCPTVGLGLISDDTSLSVGEACRLNTIGRACRWDRLFHLLCRTGQIIS